MGKKIRFELELQRFSSEKATDLQATQWFPNKDLHGEKRFAKGDLHADVRFALITNQVICIDFQERKTEIYKRQHCA